MTYSTLGTLAYSAWHYSALHQMRFRILGQTSQCRRPFLFRQRQQDFGVLTRASDQAVSQNDVGRTTVL